MPRTMNRAKRRALKTDKPLRAKLRARKKAGKLLEPAKFIILPRTPLLKPFVDNFGRLVQEGYAVLR